MGTQYKNLIWTVSTQKLPIPFFFLSTPCTHFLNSKDSDFLFWDALCYFLPMICLWPAFSYSPDCFSKLLSSLALHFILTNFYTFHCDLFLSLTFQAQTKLVKYPAQLQNFIASSSLHPVLMIKRTGQW